MSSYGSSNGKSPKKSKWFFSKKGKSNSNSPPDRIPDDVLSTSSFSSNGLSSSHGSPNSTPPSYMTVPVGSRSNSSRGSGTNDTQGMGHISPSTPKDWEKRMIDADSWKGSSSIGLKQIQPPPLFNKKGKAQDILPMSASVGQPRTDTTVHGGSFFKSAFRRRSQSKTYTSGGGSSSYKDRSGSLDLDSRTPGRSKSHGSLRDTIEGNICLDRQRHHSDDQQPSIAEDHAVRGGSIFGTEGGIGTLLAPQNTASGHIGLQNSEDARRERKKRYTHIHNDNSRDSAVPYLGEEKSVQHGQFFKHFNKSGEGSPTGPRARNLPHEPISDDKLGQRILQPVIGTKSWSKDGTYLFIPAIMATCPPVAFDLLEKMDKSIHGGEIILGKANSSKITSQFVIRKNYLFEWEPESFQVENSSRPRGFAFLQHAYVKIVDGNLQLEYHPDNAYKKNGSRSDRVKIQLTLENNTAEERNRWVRCLQEASDFTIHSLYKMDEGELGRGRYAIIKKGYRVDSEPKPASPPRILEQKNGIMKKNPSFSSISMGMQMQNMNINTKGIPRRAFKIVDKRAFYDRVHIEKERVDTIVREISVQVALMADLDSKQFLRVYGVFETFDEFIIELELSSGSDIFAHIKANGEIKEEKTIARIIYDILVGIRAMTNSGIAHRDLKLSNVMLANSICDSTGVTAKLVDFGMATFISKDGLIRGRCGTPGFVAPEICKAGVNDGYQNKVDMFSAGVILYFLLCGYEPFYGVSEKELIKENREAKVTYDLNDWSKVSVDGQDLVKKMLESDPDQRITPNDALKHPWIKRRVDPHR